MDERKTNNELSMVDVQSAGINYCDMKQMGQILDFCRMMSYSDIAPAEYRVSEKRSESTATANVFLALETAIRTKHSVFEVMQNMVPVNGRPTWKSSYLAGEVNSCGKYDKLRYEEWTDDKVPSVEIGVFNTDTKTYEYTAVPNYCCRAYATEKETGNVLYSHVVSMQMAVMEGWTKNKKYISMPQQMLIYRASAFWVRQHCPEITEGVYTKDEIEDVFGEVVETIPANQRPALTESRQNIDANELKHTSQSHIQNEINQHPTTADSQQVNETNVDESECGY